MVSKTISTKELELRIAQAATPQKKIDALIDLGWKQVNAHPVKVIDLSKQALELSMSGEFKTQPYERGKIYSLRNLCESYSFIGEYGQAISIALELLASIENDPEYTDVRPQPLITLGYCHYRLGNYPIALDHFFQALAIAEEIGHKVHQSSALDGIAYVYDEMGDFSQAIAHYEKALQLRQDDKEWQAFVLNNIAMSYVRAEKFTTALPYALDSLKLAQDHNVPRAMPHVLDTLGQAYLNLEDYPQAIHYLEQAVEFSQKTQVKIGETVALLSLGEAYSLQGERDDQALKHLHQALTMAQELDIKPEQFKCHRALANVYERQGDLRQALAHYKQFCAIEKEVFNEKADQKLKTLQVIHDTETTKKEAEIYRLRNVELQEALDRVKRLSGLLPICASCKKIRDDEGYWQQVEVYIKKHSEADFSHGICPDCLKVQYPKTYARLFGNDEEE